MASVRFPDVQTRPTEFLDLTSLTLERAKEKKGNSRHKHVFEAMPLLSRKLTNFAKLRR